MKTSNENILKILTEAGLITEEQSGDIAKRYRRRAIAKNPPAVGGGKKVGKGRRSGSDGDGTEDFLGFIVSLRLRSALDRRRIIGENDLYRSLAAALDLPFQQIDPMRLDFELVTKTVPRAFAARHLVVALSLDDNILTLATADPFDKEGLENIARSSGCTSMNTVVATRTDILKTITEFYGFKSAVVQAEKDLVPPAGALASLEQYVSLRSAKEMEATDQHVVNAVDYLFNYAFDQRASDIHLEPKREKSQIRFRIDGVLHTIRSIPLVIHPAMVSRIKMLSRLDIAERRRPQDGRIKVSRKERDFEMRVSTLPTAFGEKMVLRIFDPNILLQDIAKIGFSGPQIEMYRDAISQPHGVILVTGPTGSGKTTTLYSTLSSLATEDVNVTTIEDPIEMIHESFNQVGVQPQIGMTFDQSLRHILRQDPDIIMVGEIRDRETAANAIQAALTGHLVLSTLHTNDAPTAVVRLGDMGIPYFLVASTLLTVVAQRLVRKICPHCTEKYIPAEEELVALGIKARRENLHLRRGKGCPQCRQTGYKGRTALFEMMRVTPEIRALIHDGIDQPALVELARREGMKTLRESGVENISRGITTISEVIRVTMRDDLPPPVRR